ncbi:MAG TPA: dihydroneopterin aldolase [Bacteroidota bacterium]|nr:dihydroneopterin aldolase [Bacteroidota bacterium]
MPGNIIRIKNAVFYAYHGVASDEQNLGGKFEVDLELECDLSAAFHTDSLKSTIDYEAVYALTQRTVTERKYYLLETLGNAIAERIFREFGSVDGAVVTVRKPHPPVKGVVDYVEVVVTKKRR